jgi:NTP pyrophosphatase (non-canonical NTP hydrolase)
MNFAEYQKEAIKTAVYPNKGSNITYPVLGLNGEAGEIAEKVKKIIRDKNGFVDDKIRGAIKKELGDVLWYVAALCDELGLDMNDVAVTNIKKLKDRQLRDALHGSGDDR